MFLEYKQVYSDVKKFQTNLTALTGDERKELFDKLSKLEKLEADIKEHSKKELEKTNILYLEFKDSYTKVFKNTKHLLDKGSDDLFLNLDKLEKELVKNRQIRDFLRGEINSCVTKITNYENEKLMVPITFSELPIEEQIFRMNFSVPLLLETKLLRDVFSHIEKPQVEWDYFLLKWLEAQQTTVEISINLETIKKAVEVVNDNIVNEDMDDEDLVNEDLDDSELIEEELVNEEQIDKDLYTEEKNLEILSKGKTSSISRTIRVPKPIRSCNNNVENKKMTTTAVIVPTSVQFKEEINVEILNALLKDDYAKAYWLSFNENSIFPTWLLKSYLYSNYANTKFDSKESIQELFTIVSKHPDPMNELTGPPYNMNEIEVQLLVASIASFTSLFTPNSYINNWLNIRELAFSKISSLLKIIYDFSVHNQALPHALEDLKQVTSIHDLEKQLEQISKNMQMWLSKMKKLNFNYKPATLVFHHFIGDTHEIGEIIRFIQNKDSSKYERIQTLVSNHLVNKKTISTLIESTYVKLKEVYIRKIEGTSQSKLVDRLNELKAYFEDFSQTAQRVEELKKHSDWSNSRINRFKDQYLMLIDEVEVEVNEYIDSSKTYDGINLCSAIAEKAKATFLKIRDILIGMDVNNTKNKNESLEKSLLEPILLLPRFPGDNSNKIPNSINQEDSQLLFMACQEGKTLDKAFEDHLSKGDFTAAKIILESFYLEHAEYEHLQHTYQDQLLAVETSFKKECSKIRNLIEQSTIEHVLTESEQSELEGELLSIEESKNKQFSVHYNELNRLEEKINELRSFRKNSLMKHLEEISFQISQIDPAHQSAAREREKHALDCLNRGDIALADEYLGQIETIMVSGIQPYPVKEDYFNEFINCHDKIFNDILETKYQITLNDLKRSELAGILNMKRVPPSRRKEIETTFFSFNRLKNEKNSQEKMRYDLVKLLEYIGFLRPTVQIQHQDKSTIRASAKMTVGNDKSPLPEFGTKRNGHYQLLLLKGRPTAEMIGQYIQANGMKEQAPIVVFLGRMTIRQRKEWGEYCRKKKLTALLVDEVLIFYLASIRDLRLRALIESTMPFGYSNPYVPFSAGNVPDEMFMGRQDVVKSVMDQNGIAIIYGGRQLGKSAILRKVERDFVKSSSDYFVCLEDIRNLGSDQTSQSINDIWGLLRGWFIRKKFLRGNFTDNPQVLREEIVTLFENHPNLRILVLLDEADNFLTADSHQDFDIVTKLKQIMDDTNRRFKVVFSGLHGVQRFVNKPNHPFAQLESFNIRPLEGKAAKELIKEPLALVGYEIEDNALYRILAYTNYHPAIIQHFCRELVNHEIQTKIFGFKDPLYKIDMSSVEAVYRKNDVRKEMYDRYEWTVALDERYEVLVYAMIYDQMKERDGYRKQYNYKDILEMAKDWWEDGLKNLTLEQGRSLLNELVGLGVLVKVVNDGEYRIKNANIVRALGTPEEIRSRLERFIDKPATKDFNQQSIHRCLDTKSNIWSPLTVAQEGYLLNKQSGMSLIFSSEALGYDHIKTALKELGTKKQVNLDVRFLELPPENVSDRLIQAYFDKQLKKYKNGRIIFYLTATQLFQFPLGIIKVLEEIQKKISKQKLNRNRIVHFWITFNSEETVEWTKLPIDSRTRIEDKSNATIICESWDKEMIRRAIKVYKMMDIVPVNEAMYQATNGWPTLLYEFLEICKHMDISQEEGWDPRPLLDMFKQEMTLNEELSTSFKRKLGYWSVPFAEEILTVITMIPDVGEYELINYLEDDLKQTEETIMASFEALKRLGIVRIDNDNFVIDGAIQNLVFQT